MYKKINDSDALNAIGPAFEELSADEMELSDGMAGAALKPLVKLAVKGLKYTNVYCAVGFTVSICAYSIATS